MAKRKLMMLGPPGAGKGTQAKRLGLILDVAHISTGDMLRDARRAGTSLGVEAARYMDAGELVPDAVVIGIVAERLKSSDVADGFILDGFPRTREQAEALRGMGVELDAVLNIVVSEEEVVRRLGGRLSCGNCGAVFHREFNPPKERGVCDSCGQVGLFVREDDQPDAIRQRLVSYEAKTSPLVRFYRELGTLEDVDGSLEPSEVEANILAGLG